MKKRHACGLAVALATAMGISSISVLADSREDKIEQIQKQIDMLEDELIRLEEEEDRDGGEVVVESEQTEASTSNEAEEDIEIVKEYTLTNHGTYTRHYYIVKNNTNETVDVTTRTTAYDDAGETVGYEEGSVDALGPNCVSVIEEYFDTDKAIAEYEVDLRYGRSGLPDPERGNEGHVRNQRRRR